MHWICHCFSFKSDMHQIKLDYYLIFRESQRNFDSFLMHCFEYMKFSYFDSINLCCMHICYNELLIGDKKAWKIYTTIEIEKKQFFAVFDIVQMQYIKTDDTQTSFYVVSIYLWTFVLFFRNWKTAICGWFIESTVQTTDWQTSETNKAKRQKKYRLQ